MNKKLLLTPSITSLILVFILIAYTKTTGKVEKFSDVRINNTLDEEIINYKQNIC